MHLLSSIYQDSEVGFSEQEQKLLHSMRASRESKKSGISSTIQVRVLGNRHFRLEEVPTGLPRGKRSFLLVLFSILGHENGIWMVLRSSVARLGGEQLA